MKKIFYLIASLIMTVSVVFVLANRKDSVSVYADSDERVIGYVVEPEFVSETTKVVINQVDVSLIESTGRTVYSEWVPFGGGIVPIIPPHSNQVEPQGGVFMVLQYYYYATPLQPKVSNVWCLSNTYYSVYKAIQILEIMAEAYSDTLSTPLSATQKNNSVLSFIRNIDLSYVSNEPSNQNAFGNKWYYVTGNKHSDFISYVQSLEMGLVSISEFFASFIEANDVNTSLYPEIRNDYIANNHKMIDPTTQLAKIDLLHMITSMDGVFSYTEHGLSVYPFNEVGLVTYKHLVSWAGDLQSECLSIFNASFNIFQCQSFEDVMNRKNQDNEPCSLFPIEDLYADVDAVNMAFNVNLSLNTTCISTIFYNYYNLSVDSRFTIFISTVASMTTFENMSNDEKFETISCEMMKLDVQGNNLANGTNIHDAIKYSFLYGGIEMNASNLQTILFGNYRSGLIDSSIRFALASLYIEYIFERAEEEL